MQLLVKIVCCLPLAILLGSEETPPELDKADEVNIYYLGRSDLDTPLKNIKDAALIGNLAGLILRSEGPWERRPMPGPSGRDIIGLSFRKANEVICSVEVGKDFLVRTDADRLAGVCYFKHVDTKAIRRIASKLWFGPNGPEL